jgi:flagellar assembly factor FliW
MPKIKVKGQEFTYNEDEIINFARGLVGLPELQRAVLVPLSEFSPFRWLVSIEDETIRLVVANPYDIFADYNPSDFVILSETDLQTFVILKISPDWRKTTVNLRAPIFINTESNRGVQLVLTDSPYKMSENLPQPEFVSSC